jgi:predicted RNA-binding protein with TRAM domain
MFIMKKFMLSVMIMLVVLGVMVGCSAGMTPDYTTEELEAALNNGDDVTGKTVEVEVEKFEPASAFGYNMQAGEHLNFVSSDNPGVKDGDTIVVEIEKAASMMGSWMITYKK